ncbi:hypothetical protein LKO31_08205 [Sphingopyxis sp. FBM22]|nr:hypothetical protein [Sphingopyxis yananensis]
MPVKKVSHIFTLFNARCMVLGRKGFWPYAANRPQTQLHSLAIYRAKAIPTAPFFRHPLPFSCPCCTIAPLRQRILGQNGMADPAFYPCLFHLFGGHMRL